MNKALEELKALIRARAERFGYLDQVMIYTQLAAFCDEEIRISMMQEYGTTGWEDEE